jgi:hypothetical protein
VPHAESPGFLFFGGFQVDFIMTPSQTRKKKKESLLDVNGVE